MKRLMALMLSLTFLLTALPLGTVSVSAEEDYPYLQLGVVTEAVITEEEAADKMTYFRFTPEESGCYVFYSTSDDDTWGCVCTGDYETIGSNDDGGEDNNFRVACYLTGGETYLLGARFYSRYAGSFPVCIEVYEPEEYPYLQEGVITEATRMEGSSYAYFYFTPTESGYHIFKSVHTGQDSTFAYGAVCNILGATLKSDWKSDEQGNFRVAYDMTAGETYLLRLEIYNTQSFPICIVKEEPRTITNVEFLDDTILLEDTYDLESRMRVTYSDGAVEEITDFRLEDDIHYDMYYINTSYDTPSSQWKVGGTYTVHAYAYEPGGDERLWESDYTVTVVETPVASVEIDPITLIKEYDGYWYQDWIYDEETGEESNSPQYFYYYGSYPQNVTITLKDGTVIKDATSIEGTSFEWNGRRYSMSAQSQSYENRLLPGVNERTYSIAGYEGTYVVNVDTLVASVEIAGTLTRIENSDGYWTTDTIWDEETGERVQSPEYFYYESLTPDWGDITITLIDGTVINDTYFEYQGDWYYFETVRQTYDTRLRPGTNEVAFSIAGYEGTYTVEIVETPVASVEIEPVTLIENGYGRWTSDRVWDEETGEYIYPEYFSYYITPRENCTITLKDGTVIQDTYFVWKDKDYSLHIPQSYDTRLLLGTNEVAFSIGGYEGTYTVEIVETPIASVEIKPFLVAENINGYWDTDTIWDEETGQYVYTEFFYYENISPDRDNCVITLKDGTVIKGTQLEWENRTYLMERESQSYENQLLPGLNELSYSIAGYEGTYTVEVVDTPVASHWAAPIRIQENQYGYWVDAEDEETGDTTGERYFHYNYLESAIRSHLFLTMKNGIQQFADDSEYYVEVEQSYENRLLPGLNEVTFSIAGYTGTCTVEVVESSVASVEVEPIVYTQYADATVDYDRYWDEETQQDIRIPYFRYDVRPETITLTFTDGTTATYAVQYDWWWWMDAPCIVHNGEEYAISFDNGSYYNRDWGVGVHTVSASVMGCQFTYTVEIVERDTDSVYEYIPAEGGIIITDCYFPEETMEIPAAIDGKTVIGVADLPYEVKHLILPDTVATIGDWLLSDLVSVSFGAGVRNLHAGMFEHCYDLQSVTIAPANPYFTVIDGAVYDKAGTTFIGYPMKGEDLTHIVPRTAVDLGALNFNIYNDLSVTLEEGNPNAVTIDGVTYDKGMTRVLFCDPDKEGVYVMPSTVTDIAEAAFRGCSKLTEVTISPSVTTIVYCAFQWCSGIEVLNLPEGLVSIERYAFADTTSLESVDLPETLETIGSLAFEDSGLTSLTLPDATKEVYYSAFRYSNIATLDLGSGVEYIGEEVFCGTPVESVALPHSLTYLGSGAFSGCGNLKSVSIGQGLTAIRDRTFSHSGLESITIPANVQSIGYYAFAYCDSLRQVILTNGLESIGEEAFYHNPALEEIVIPDSVTYLGRRAFKWCESLTRAVIGAGITYIDEDTFAHCPLEEVDFRGRLETIGTFAFTDGNMTSIAIPDSVTSIMYGAFLGCEQLEEIHLPPSVMDLGGGAFHDTAWYAAQPKGMTYLAHAAYYWKGDMAPDTAVTIPEEITLLADWVLANQYNLTAVDLPESLRVIGDNAFRQDINLTTLYLGKNVERVQELAFYRCYGLTDVYYTGSEADRAAMVIEDYNDPLLNATWHYNICADDAHVYDNYCDNTCNRCDWVRPDAPGHTYRNQCDADCNNCGLTRTPPHKYGDACDAACNGCGLTREPPHQYADKYDAECDLCGAVREVTLVVYGDANGDNKVNVRDIGVIQQNLNGWDVELNLDACDVNGDGKVNVRDLGLIQQFINGWDVQLGPQK